MCYKPEKLGQLHINSYAPPTHALNQKDNSQFVRKN